MANYKTTMGNYKPVASSGNIFAKVVKPTDESVTSSTSMQDDDHIKFTPAISKTYSYVIFFRYHSTITNNIKYKFTVPTGCTMFRTGTAQWKHDMENIEIDMTADSTLNTNTDGIRLGISTGTIIMSTTAGAITLQWAQQSSNATAATIKAGTYLIVYEE